MRNETIFFLLRSTINPASILCTDGSFHAESFVGPGTGLSAKLYKTRTGADRAMERYAATVEMYIERRKMGKLGRVYI